ncbi:MAG: ATP-binding cassette domain-containing protein, partial [Microcystis aeruginosa]
MSTIITISNLWAGYEQEPILEDINLTIQELDFLGIIGPNGGGKTTLLKVLLGLIKPWRGEVSILG